MSKFEQLISDQINTMDKLLFLQSELERCQQIESELINLQNEAKLDCVRIDIVKMKEELKDIQQKFQWQTEEVIKSYQEMKVSI